MGSATRRCWRSWPGRDAPQDHRAQEAFTGYFTGHHAFLLATMLVRVDAIDADIAALDVKIEQLAAPLAPAAGRLAEIPGINATAACAILAGIGTDMDRFPTAGHLVSWAKFAPGVKESGEERQGHDRAWQPLPGPGPRQRRRLHRPDRHLPGRAVPAHRPPPRQPESRRRHRPLPADHHLAPARRPHRPLHRPGQRFLPHPDRPPNAANATTSASSKRSATRSPSNPRPDRQHQFSPAPPGAAARPLTLRFSDQVQRAVVVTCVVTRRWFRAGHQSNRELPPITDSILVVRRMQRRERRGGDERRGPPERLQAGGMMPGLRRGSGPRPRPLMASR